MNSSTGAGTGNAVIGVLLPPPGVEANFVNPESISWKLVDTLIVGISLSTPVCLLRLYTSRWIVGRFHLDDGFIAMSLILAIAYTICNIYQTQYGIGRHIWDVQKTEFSDFRKIGALGVVPTFNLSILCTKTSILLFYLRFPVTKLFRIATYIVMFISAANCLTTALGVLYLCRPMAFKWDSSLHGTCINGNVPFLLTAALNVVTDVAILLLPLWLLAPLRISYITRIGLTLVFMAGGLVTAVSVVRLAAIPQSWGNTDLTWQYTYNFIWVAIEMNTAIICACMPCLKAFIKHHFPNFHLLSREGRSNLTLRTVLTGAPRPEYESKAGESASQSDRILLAPRTSNGDQPAQRPSEAEKAGD